MEEGKLIYSINCFVFNNLARRALDQSNGAMFLNRKLIVQLSTSRFRPQPKEINSLISQPPKQLIIMSAPSYHHPTGGSTILKEQQYNYDMMTSTKSLSPISDNQNFFRPPSPLSQDMNNYYSQYSNLSTTSSLKINKNIKAGNFN